MVPNRDVVLVTGSSGLIGSALVRSVAGRFRVVGFECAGDPHASQEAQCDYVDVCPCRRVVGPGVLASEIAPHVLIRAFIVAQRWLRMTLEMGRVLWLLLLAFGVGPVAMANQNDVTAGPGERLTREAPRPKVEWSAADRALRAAMDADPTYTSGTPKRLTQPAAIAAWTGFLERSDLTKEQQIFAQWRLGSLCAYNFDQSRGEAADYGKAERAFAKARELLGDLVTRESLNSATVWASIPGTKREKARRMATAFNWLFTRTNDDINRSAERINQSGYVVDKKFFPNIAHRESTLDERKRFLRKQLAEHRELAVRMVTEAIQYSRAQDAEIIAELLKSIEGAADPKQTTTWREMHRRLSR